MGSDRSGELQDFFFEDEDEDELEDEDEDEDELQ